MQQHGIGFYTHLAADCPHDFAFAASGIAYVYVSNGEDGMRCSPASSKQEAAGHSWTCSRPSAPAPATRRGRCRASTSPC